MILKTLIAAGTIAALVAAVPAQEAQAGVNVDVYIGAGGYYPDYGYGYGYGHAYPVRHWDNTISCHKGGKIVRWNGFHKVNAVDCSLPRYKYTAWRAGHKYLVTVNRRGGIADVDRLY